VFLLGSTIFFTSPHHAEAAWKFIIVVDSRGSDNGVNTPILTEIASEIVSHDTTEDN
jgi:hypothetical protein